MLDPRLVEDAANRLDTDEGLVEKDWHVVRAISVIASLDHGGMQPAFSGGTSLSAARGLIKRFSEDIDFKVATPVASSTSQARAHRRRYRERVLAALNAADFEVIGKPLGGREGNFFSTGIAYHSEFAVVPGLRSKPPEIPGFPGVDSNASG